MIGVAFLILCYIIFFSFMVNSISQSDCKNNDAQYMLCGASFLIYILSVYSDFYFSSGVFCIGLISCPFFCLTYGYDRGKKEGTEINKDSSLWTACLLVPIIYIIENVLILFKQYSLNDFLLVISDIDDVIYPSNDELGFVLVISIISLLVSLLYFKNTFVINKNIVKKYLLCTLIFYIVINVCQAFFFFVPSNYSIYPDEYITEEYAKQIASQKTLVVSSDDTAFSTLKYNKNYRETDNNIEDYIKSITSNNIPYLFDNKTYVHSISCKFSEKEELLAISLELEKCSDYYDDDDCFHKFHISKKVYPYHHLYEKNFADSISWERWKCAAQALSKKYGKPFLGEYSNSESVSNLYWATSNQIIHLYIEGYSWAKLTYMSNSYILNVLKEIDVQKYKDAQYEKKRLDQERNDSIQKQKENEVKKSLESKQRKEIESITSNSI